VTYLPEPFEEPPANLDFALVYEDEWMLGVDKPPNLLVHRAGRAVTHNLVYQLRNGAEAVPGATAVNRLDRETSGLVLIARDSRNVPALTGALKAPDTRKEYLAVVRCSRPPEPQTVTVAVGKDPASTLSYRHAVVPDGKPAVSEIEQVESIGTDHALLRLLAVTGRTHQLRLHCAHLGCPIVGDRLYGVDRGEGGNALPRQALHCTKVTFGHPFSGAPTEIEAPLPADMQGLIDRIRQGAAD
jgi:23S rRNA pseudouridine1911/1915/1917 synthase